MSEKVKCPNPDCENGKIVDWDSEPIQRRYKGQCEECQGTGFIPAPDGLLTDEELLELPANEFILKADGSVDIRKSRLNREKMVAKAQAALTARQIFEEIEKEIIWHNNIPHLTPTFWQSLKSRYGVK